MRTIDFNDFALKDLSVMFWFEDHMYQFNVGHMRRDLTDGGSNPIFSTTVYEDAGRKGTVTLTADWRVKSLIMED